MNDEANIDEYPVAAGVAAPAIAPATATATTATAITPVADVINRSRMRTSLIDRRQRSYHLSTNNSYHDTTNNSIGGNIVEVGVVFGGNVHDGRNVKNYERIAHVVPGAYGTSRSGEMKFNRLSNWFVDPFFKVPDIGWMEPKTKQEGSQGNGLFLSSEASSSHS